MEYLGEYLLRNAKEFPDRIAVIHGERQLTYRELNTECDRLANALTAAGIKKGDRVAVLSKSCLEWLVLLYACQKLGVGIALVHARLLPEEILRTIDMAEAHVLFYGQEFADKAASMAALSQTRLKLIGFGPAGDGPAPEGSQRFEDLLRLGSAEEAQIPLAGSDDSVILFTSGTTSAARGIVRTQKTMCAYAALFEDAASLKKRDILLTPSPLYHAAGLCCVIKMLVNAGTLVVLSSFDAEKICRQIQQFQVTQVALVPPLSYQRLKESHFPEQYDLSSVMLAHIAAGKASRECVRDLFSMFPNAKLRLSWGSTEASNITCSILGREELQRKPQLLGSVGKINAVADLQLVAEDGSVVQGVGDGEAYVRSPLVFSAYIKNPALTEASFSDGWFKTEDILHRDEEGYYYLLDRKKDIIKTGGENVYAQEVEQAILENPAVAECAVVGIPDPKFGEAVAAAVVLKAGCSISAEEFVLFCRSVLPSFKKPKYWAVMEELPKNYIGKVCKPVLKKRAEELFVPIA